MPDLLYACLPASFLSLVPDTLPSALVAVLPGSISDREQNSNRAKSESNHVAVQTALVNGRIATVVSANTLLSSPNDHSSADDDVLSIALLSPCLLSAIRQRDGISTVSCKIVQGLSCIKFVRLQCLIPHPLSAEHAERAADAAKAILQQREVAVRDVFPVSAGLWFRVVAVQGSGLVDPKTKVAIIFSSAPQMQSGIDPQVREWATEKWRLRPRWTVSKYATLLSSALDASLGVILLLALDADARDIIEVVSIGRLVHRVRWGSEKQVLEALTRIQLSGGGTVIIQGFNGTTLDAISAFLRSKESQFFLEPEKESACMSCVIVCEYNSDLAEKVVGIADYEVVVPPAEDLEREELLLKSVSNEREGSVDNADLPQLVRMCTGFARADVNRLGALYCYKGTGHCREVVSVFGKGQISADTGGVGWEDIGGLDTAKQLVTDLIDLPVTGRGGETENVSVNVNLNRRIGVLLYGPPGTGKTLLARAVARQFRCSFISVKGPELYAMYVGESEKNVRAVFEHARQSAPCVIFFDEIDALAPSRGRMSDSGGVGDRVVSQLVAEFDGIVSRRDIFVIAASNRPDLVDPGLLRPGRLEKMVYVPMPTTREAQATILKTQTRKFMFDGEISFDEVLSHAPPAPTISGADLYGMASGAWKNALKRYIARRRESANGDFLNKPQHIVMERAVKQAASWGQEAEQRYEGFFEKSQVPKEREKHSIVNTMVEEIVVTAMDLIGEAQRLSPSLSIEQVHDYAMLQSRIETGN